MIYQVWKTSEDPCGNPRRITVVFSQKTGDIIEVLEHGYLGDRIPKNRKRYIILPDVRVIVKEYWETIKFAREQGFYEEA